MKSHSAILILFLLALPACSYFTKKEDSFKKCPSVGMVSDAQGWAEPPSSTEWKARAQINEFDMKCKISKTATTIVITAKVGAERNGEVTDSLRQELPFFIASMRGDDVLNKKTENRYIDFGSRERMVKEDFTLSIELPFNDDGTSADRSVFFGFQLNEEQLSYIRSLRDDRANAAINTPASPAPEAR